MKVVFDLDKNEKRVTIQQNGNTLGLWRSLTNPELHFYYVVDEKGSTPTKAEIKQFIEDYEVFTDLSWRELGLIS